MAEYTPTTEQVRAAFIAQEDFYARVASLEPPTNEESGEDFDRWLAEVRREAAEKAAVEVGVCEHQNASYLRMMSERDALRAEVERLRGVERGWQHDRAEWERERDEARQQLADLRTGIEALRERAARLGLDEAAEDANTLLAGSGEQPGERDATPDEAHDIGYSKGHADGYREAMAERRPAPMVPDSTDVRYLADRIETAMTDDGHRMPRTDETRYLAHVAAQTALAVVGQGVTAEQARAEAERRFQDRDAGAERSLHHWFIEGALWASAAARTAMPALLGFVREVRAMHVSSSESRGVGRVDPETGEWGAYCDHDGEWWPCVTIQALTKRIGGA